MALSVLKLGGGKHIGFESALTNLAAHAHAGESWILVHGASDEANRLGEQEGYPPRTIVSPGGHISRYNDVRTIDIFARAARTVNERLVQSLESSGVGTARFTEPGVILAERKKAIRAIQDGRTVVIRDDYSGRIVSVNDTLLRAALGAGKVPVVAPLALGTEGEVLNVDGDLAAAAIACALEATTVIVLTNVPGLLRNLADESSIITSISQSQLAEYERFAEGRMKKKLLAAQAANCHRFIISSAKPDRPIDEALAGAGTHIIG